MTANEHSAKREPWIVHFWRILAAWDDAISADPFESLEKRVAALEQAVFELDHEKPATRKRAS